MKLINYVSQSFSVCIVELYYWITTWLSSEAQGEPEIWASPHTPENDLFSQCDCDAVLQQQLQYQWLFNISHVILASFSLYILCMR